MGDPDNSAPRLRGLRRVLAIAVCVVLGILFLVEVVLRFVPLPGFSHAELAPDYVESEAQHKAQPHPYLGYSLKPEWASKEGAKSQVSHNSLFLRGPETTLEKPADVVRIVCLGGSSTYGNTPSSDAKTWPVQLQSMLNAVRPASAKRVEVLNAGVFGYSTFESTVNLAFRMIEFRPDLVIVYHSINDARCALYGEPVPDNTHWRAVWPVYRASPLEPLFERSMTYLIWRKYATNYLQQRADVGYYAIVGYHPDQADPYVKQTIPHQGLANFQRNLVTLQAIARAHGARVLFATQGIDVVDMQKHGSADSQLAAMEEMRRLIEQVSAERSVPFLDAGTVLEEEAARQRAESPDGEQGVFTWEVHLTDAGAELLARTLAEFILDQTLLP